MKKYTDKKEEKIKKNPIIILLFIIMIIFLASISLGLMFSLKVNSGGDTANSDQILICSWVLGETTTANVTWYRYDGSTTTQNITQNNIACTAFTPCSTAGDGNIPVGYAKKGDKWTCVVTYINTTTIESQNVTVTITNSPPTPPRVWLNNVEKTNVTTLIQEDSTTIFLVNSTDADNDVIQYTINDTSFCTIGLYSGILNCNPTLETQLGNRTLHIGATDGPSAQYIDFIINVNATNDPPYFSPALFNHTMANSNPVYQGYALNYVIGVADPENDGPYNFSIQTDLSTLIIEKVTNSTARIRFNNSMGIDKAEFYDKGNHTVNVSVIDNGWPPMSFNRSFVVEVIPHNNLPNYTLIIFNNDSLIEGGNLSIFINATDIDNSSLTFATNNYRYNFSASSTDFSDPNGVSYAYSWINITNLTNDYVVHNSFTITIFDSQENLSIPVVLNITNVNNPPAVFEISYYGENTLSNKNISKLTAYTNVLFRYRINATDIDMLTYQGDTLTFSTSNASAFSINSTTGIIQFIPSNVGNFTYTVFVRDSSNNVTNITANIEVLYNQNPIFTQNPIVIQCFEFDSQNYPWNCMYNLSANATDMDLGDYIQTFDMNTSLFQINKTTGIINFTASQSMIGTYSIYTNITDTRGGYNYTYITLMINNTNNPPTVNQTIVIPPGRMVIGNSYQVVVFGNDQDMALPTPLKYENITFNISVSGPNPEMFSIIKSSDYQATLSLNPQNSSDAGDYLINVTVTDYYHNTSAPKIIPITVYNITLPPTIYNVSPFGTPFVNDSIDTSWMDFALFFDHTTNITIYENSTYDFNQTSSADTRSYPNTLNYTWYYDGNPLGNKSDFTEYFDFFSSGMHNITFLAYDDFNYTNTFTWYTTIINVNRPPILMHPLDNLSVNGTTTYNNYMTYYNSETKFIDPDDDINHDGKITGNESTLIFNATPCTFASFSFIGSDLKVKTLAVGACRVNFTATDSQDSSLTINSNTVLINITTVSNESSIPQPIPITVSGGGGASVTTITVPLPEEVEKPRPFTLVTPRLVTVYKNATIKIPIVLNNTWNGTLEGVRLKAYTNATNVTIYLDKVYFPRIAEGASEEITLLLANYKSEGHYEIQVTANVSNLNYEDTATIFVNSAELKSEGDQIDSKISFTRDLLSSNPECQELTELLNQAKKELSNNNYASSARLVDDVINGCKYLVSNSKSNQENPSKGFVKTFEWNSKYNEYVIITGFGIAFCVALYFLFKKENVDTDF